MLKLTSPQKPVLCLDTESPPTLRVQGQRPRYLQCILAVHPRPIKNEDSNLQGNLGRTTLSILSDPLIEYVFIRGLGGGSTKPWMSQARPCLIRNARSDVYPLYAASVTALTVLGAIGGYGRYPNPLFS